MRAPGSARHPVLHGAPLLIAHRGGAGLMPENTLEAFVSAVEDWAADMIELDVHASRDGHCVVIHDPTLERTTNGRGLVAAHTLAELQQLDAGHNFTSDGGRTFSFRGRGIRVPTFESVLTRLPDTRIIVEVKDVAAQAPLFDAIRRHGASSRVIVAGMYDRDRTLFASYDGAISASGETLKKFYVMHRLGLARFASPGVHAVQMPEDWNGRRVLTARLVRDLAHHDIPVHVWTVNTVPDMVRLLDAGVEGILTDRPDLASPLFQQRFGRAPAPIERNASYQTPAG